jgi:hypothetical protein
MKYIKSSSYAEYVAEQVATNKRKLNKVWVTDEEIAAVAQCVKRLHIEVRTGVCHGVRNGYEVARFRELICRDIFGTEISDTATLFDNVIQWDFHEVKDEWISHFDFIYSNSFDHSYDIELCLSRWRKTLSPQGVCFLEWDPETRLPTDKADCLGIEFNELVAVAQKSFTPLEVLDVCGALGRKILVLRS